MKYLFFILVIFFSQSALAADYSVSPLLIEHTTEPRDVFEETVKITNSTDRKIRIFPTVNEINVNDDGGVESFVSASMSDNTTSVTSWISVTRGRVEINPGETIKIPISFAINPQAESGEYHAFVGFAEGSKREDSELLVASGRAPGVVVRLSLVEKRSEYLRLNRFNISRFIISEDKAAVYYDLENIGGIAIVPAGEIIIYDRQGVEISTMPVNPEKISIEPNSTKSFVGALPDLGFVGRYKALLNVEYGSKQRSNLYDTTYFNIIPLLPLIAIFATLLLLSIILVFYYHRSQPKPLPEHEEVNVYVRSGKQAVEKDHDINLKN